MGDVIRFPHEAGYSRRACIDAKMAPAAVIILPVIRIERHTERAEGVKPAGSGARRGRRRRAAR